MNAYPSVDFEPSAPVLTDKECDNIYKFNPEISNQEKINISAPPQKIYEIQFKQDPSY